MIRMFLNKYKSIAVECYNFTYESHSRIGRIYQKFISKNLHLYVGCSKLVLLNSECENDTKNIKPDVVIPSIHTYITDPLIQHFFKNGSVRVQIIMNRNIFMINKSVQN